RGPAGRGPVPHRRGAARPRHPGPPAACADAWRVTPPMPAYVKRGGLAFDCSPPITAHRARACAFLVPAEVDYINRIIDTQLNYPSQLAVEFYALFPYVLVYF